MDNSRIERTTDLPSCDRIQIGWDYKEDSEDVACLTVMRRSGRGAEVISVFHGEEAIWMYARLVNGSTKSEPRYMRCEIFDPSKEVPLSSEIVDLTRKNPWLVESMHAKLKAMQEKTNNFERCDIVMPKGVGLTEAKENFKRYMNEYWGLPIPNHELGMMSFERFEISYKCKISVLEAGKPSRELKVRFDFEDNRHMEFNVNETELMEMSPRQIQHHICLQALVLYYKEEK